MENKKIILIIFGIFLIGLASSLPIYVKPLDVNGNLQSNTSFIYTFNFTTNADCSGVVLSNTSTIITGLDGIGFIDLDISGISAIPSYLCEFRDGVSRANISLSDQIFREIYARNLNLTGNATATYYFGSGEYLTGLAGGGDINAVNTDGPYLTGGADSGVVNLLVNESYLNISIDARATGLGDNESFNQNLTDFLYRANDWDNITGIPYATPSDGDTTHFSLAGEIYSWIMGFGYYSATDFSISDYLTSATIYGFGYYNATDFSISDYFTKTNILNFGYYNSSDFTIGDYALDSKVDSLGNYSDENSTIARIGNCPSGQFVQNATTGGVECLVPTLSESDPLWTANQSNYFNTTDIIAFGYYNGSDFVITDYFTKSDIEGFNYYNSTDFSIADYFTSAEVLAFNYYNSSDFNINDYLNLSILFSFNYYNSSDFNINDYATDVKVDSLGNFSAWDKDYNDLTNAPSIPIIWDATFNNTGDGRWLDDTTIGNCSGDQSCANVLYTTDEYLGGLGCADTKIAKWNNTLGAWYCSDDEVGEPGAGDIEGVLTDGNYLTGGCTTGTCSLLVNETKLNDTIDARDSDTTYTNGSGISLVGTEFNHSDTSSQASDDNSGNTFIQDIVLDTFGHITSIVNAGVDFSSYLAIADLVGLVGNWSNDKSDYWNASLDIDTVIGNDEIAESKIEFTTTCASGSHYYLDGNDLACETDDDTTYTAGSNLTLIGTEFSANMTAMKNFWDTIYSIFGASVDDTEMANEDFGEFTCTGEEDGCTLDSGVYDDEYVELGDSFTNNSGDVAVTGAYNALVLTIDHDALDDQYYDSEADLTTLLDDNYEGEGVHFDISTTTNITCFNSACTLFINATDGCQYFPSGGKICSGV